MSKSIASANSRLEAMHFGVADYAACNKARTVNIGGLNPDYPGDQWHFALSRMTVACRAYGLRPIDGPFGDFSDPDGYTAGAKRAAALGIEGKWAIHPSQIELANDVFSPTAKEVERAERIIDALKEAEAQGKGAASLDGKMIDAASERMASNVLVTAAAIKKRSKPPAPRPPEQHERPGNQRQWTFTSTRPRNFSRSSASIFRAAASPTAPSRRPIAPARSAAANGSSRRRSIPVRAARPAASSSARATTRSSDAAEAMLGKKLVTHQTGPRGKLVSRLYVEEAIDIAKEIYLGFVLDRDTERIMIVASAAGGMEIEEIAAKQPDSIIRVTVDPGVGMQQFQAREIAFGLGVEPEIDRQAGPRPSSAATACSATRRLDARDQSAGRHRDKNLVALDAKMSFDENALFRRPESPSCATRPRKIRARPSPATAASPMSASTATSAASSTAPASPWRRST